MPTVDISDGKVFPEDVGTDAPSDYTQPDSAGFFGGLARHASLLQYVETGLGFSADFGTNTLDIGSGLAFLLADGAVTVQNEDGEYSDTWHSGMAIAVDVPEVTGISLATDSDNHVFLAVDMSAGNGTYYETNTTNEQPVDPYVKLGIVDTLNDTVGELNRDPEGTFSRIFATETVDDPDALTRREYVDAEISSVRNDYESDLTAHTDTADAHHTRPSAGTNLTESSNVFSLVDSPSIAGDIDVSGKGTFTSSDSRGHTRWIRGDNEWQVDYGFNGWGIRHVEENGVSVSAIPLYIDRDHQVGIGGRDNFHSAVAHVYGDALIEGPLTVEGDITENGDDVVSSPDGDYEIQKNGTDGAGIVNFKTE